ADANTGRWGERNVAGKAQLRLWEDGALRKDSVCDSDLILRDRRFTMNCHSGCCLVFRRAAEDVHAEVVANETGQQFALRITSVLGVPGGIISRWLDRGPRWSPKWIDP